MIPANLSTTAIGTILSSANWARNHAMPQLDKQKHPLGEDLFQSASKRLVQSTYCLVFLVANVVVLAVLLGEILPQGLHLFLCKHKIALQQSFKHKQIGGRAEASTKEGASKQRPKERRAQLMKARQRQPQHGAQAHVMML